jgi:hypothetical protein
MYRLAFQLFAGLILIWGCSHSARAENRISNEEAASLISTDELEIPAIIARVHLVSRTPVSTQPYNIVSPYPIIGVVRDEPICGYMYHAKVVESITGDQKEFDFFSSEDADFSGLDHDYLVVVYKRWDGRKFLDAADLRLTIPMSEVRRINCLIAEKYYVARLTQSMFSFDNTAAAMFGGEWLAPSNRPGFPCCAFAGPNTRQVKSDPDSYGMKSWAAHRPYIARLSKWVQPLELPPEGYYPVASWSELREWLFEMKRRRKQEKVLPPE